MIGRLKGILLAKQPPALLIDVHGVGYDVQAPMTTFYELPAIGAEVVLHTHLAVREDAHVLYGFLRDSDRAMFRSLIKVSGVGPKLALAILSGMSASEFAACVHAGDSAALTRLPGVGKKTAERLVVEMRDRLDDWDSAAITLAPGGRVAPVKTDAVRDAISALIALGYKPQEASRMVSAIDTTEMRSEDVIRQALRAAAP